MNPHKNAWLAFLNQEEKEMLEALLEKSHQDHFFPKHEDKLKAFEFFSPETCKVVIIGQDPYHQRGQAMGLAFSVHVGQPCPPSLKNIFKELEQSFGHLRQNPCLTDWAEQGVLLLNRSLSVEEGKAGSHAHWGWEALTEAICSRFSQSYPDCPFILLGKKAQALEHQLRSKFILKAEHPSPLSAYRGFLGSGIFKSCNEILIQKGENPVDWLGSIETPHRLPL